MQGHLTCSGEVLSAVQSRGSNAWRTSSRQWLSHMPSHHISHQPGIWLIQSLFVWWGRLSILKPCYGISSCRAWTCHGNFKQSFFLLATSHLLDVQSLDLYNQEACRAGRECAITHFPQVLCISLMDPCLSSSHLIQPVSNWIVFCHAQWTQCNAQLVRVRTLCGDHNPTLNCW